LAASLNPEEIEEDEGEFYFNKEEVLKGSKLKER
jgi:hypothetical protein